MTAEEIPHSLKDAIGLPCNCDDAYKSRNLSAPDCPKCNYQETIEIDVMAWCRLQIEKDRERVKEHAKVKKTESYSGTREIKSKSEHAFIEIMPGFSRSITVDHKSIDETPITLD